MTQAAFAFSIMAFFVKLASRTLPSMEIVFFRGLIGTLMILAVLVHKRLPVFGKEKGVMFLRGIVGFIALALHFYTIAHLPLGTAVMLNYTAPIFAAVFAIFFLKERVGIFLWVMLLASFAGVYLLVDTNHVWNRMAFLALLSAVFTGGAYVLIRALRDRESPFTIIFYFTFVSLIGSAFSLPFGMKAPDLREWLLLLGLGISSFFGQWWFTLCLRYAPPALVGPFAYLTPLLSFLYGLFFLQEKMTPASWTGAAIIIISGSVISYLEARQGKDN